MIIIGCINIDFENTDIKANLSESDVTSATCPLQPHIPFYLLVAGILNIALLVLRIIFQRCCKQCCGGDATDSKFCATCGFLANFACINIFDMIALTLIIIWLVIGTVWVFKAWDKVDTDGAGKNCEGYLYYFSAASAIITWIAVACAIVCGLLSKVCSCIWSILCCKPCRKAEGQPV